MSHIKSVNKLEEIQRSPVQW